MNVVVKSIFSKDDSGSDSDSDSETRAQKRRKLEPKSVIRIVFALASPKPAVIFGTRPEKRHHLGGLLTTFDIWLAGLSNETFRQIQSQDLTHYKTLLECSLPHDPYAFQLEDVPKIGNMAKKSRGARRRKMVPLAFPENAHHRIHQAGLEMPGDQEVNLSPSRQRQPPPPARAWHNMPIQK